MNRKTKLCMILGLFSVLFLMCVSPVFGSFTYQSYDTIEFGNIGGYELIQLGETYDNYTFVVDAENLSLGYAYAPTFVMAYFFNNVSNDGYCVGYGQYAGVYYNTLYTVDNNVFTLVNFTTGTHIWSSDLPLISNAIYGRSYLEQYNDTGNGYVGSVYCIYEFSSPMVDLTSVRLWVDQGSELIGGAAFIPWQVSDSDFYHWVVGSVTLGLDVGRGDLVLPAPTVLPTEAPGISDDDLGAFLDFAVVAAVLFVPSLICAVILGKWGFFAGLTIGAVSGYVALGGALFPVWIPIGVGLFDFVMFYQSARGSI